MGLGRNPAAGILVIQVLRLADAGIENNAAVLIVGQLVVHLHFSFVHVYKLPARGVSFEEGIGSVHVHR